MDNQAVIDKIMKNLAFELKPGPTEPTNEGNSNKTDALNVKIKVRNKETQEAISQRFISNNQPEPEMILQKVRLVNSDETLMSFDILVEKEYQQKILRKPQKHFLRNLKPGLCLKQMDDNDHIYQPSSRNNINAPEDKLLSKPDGFLRRSLTLSKNRMTTFKNTGKPRNGKTFLGTKCKPGGCLDSAFDEDTYSYGHDVEVPNIKEFKKSTKVKTEHSGAEFQRDDINLKKKYNQSKDIPVFIKPNDNNSELSFSSILLYKKKSSRISLITYPPQDDKIVGNIKISKERKVMHRSSSSNEDRTQQPITESNNSFFNPPKGIKRDSDIKHPSPNLELVDFNKVHLNTNHPNKNFVEPQYKQVSLDDCNITRSNVNLNDKESTRRTHILTNDENCLYRDTPRKEKTFLGTKCKAGGCLDPPFGEDNYSYGHNVKVSQKVQESTKITEVKIGNSDSELQPNNINLKNMNNQTKDTLVLTKPIDDNKELSFSSIVLNKNKSSRNSLVTYPLHDEKNVNKIMVTMKQQVMVENNFPNEDRIMQGVPESNNSFLIPPEPVKQDYNIQQSAKETGLNNINDVIELNMKYSNNNNKEPQYQQVSVIPKDLTIKRDSEFDIQRLSPKLELNYFSDDNQLDTKYPHEKTKESQYQKVSLGLIDNSDINSASDKNLNDIESTRNFSMSSKDKNNIYATEVVKKDENLFQTKTSNDSTHFVIESINSDSVQKEYKQSDSFNSKNDNTIVDFEPKLITNLSEFSTTVLPIPIELNENSYPNINLCKIDSVRSMVKAYSCDNKSSMHGDQICNEDAILLKNNNLNEDSSRQSSDNSTISSSKSSKEFKQQPNNLNQQFSSACNLLDTKNIITESVGKKLSPLLQSISLIQTSASKSIEHKDIEKVILIEDIEKKSPNITDSIVSCLKSIVSKDTNDLVTIEIPVKSVPLEQYASVVYDNQAYTIDLANPQSQTERTSKNIDDQVVPIECITDNTTCVTDLPISKKRSKTSYDDSYSSVNINKIEYSNITMTHPSDNESNTSGIKLHSKDRLLLKNQQQSSAYIIQDNKNIITFPVEKFISPLPQPVSSEQTPFAKSTEHNEIEKSVIIQDTENKFSNSTDSIMNYTESPIPKDTTDMISTKTLSKTISLEQYASTALAVDDIQANTIDLSIPKSQNETTAITIDDLLDPIECVTDNNNYVTEIPISIEHSKTGTDGSCSSANVNKIEYSKITIITDNGNNTSGITLHSEDRIVVESMPIRKDKFNQSLDESLKSLLSPSNESKQNYKKYAQENLSNNTQNVDNIMGDCPAKLESPLQMSVLSEQNGSTSNRNNTEAKNSVLLDQLSENLVRNVEYKIITETISITVPDHANSTNQEILKITDIKSRSTEPSIIMSTINLVDKLDSAINNEINYERSGNRQELEGFNNISVHLNAKSSDISNPMFNNLTIDKKESKEYIFYGINSDSVCRTEERYQDRTHSISKLFVELPDVNQKNINHTQKYIAKTTESYTPIKEKKATEVLANSLHSNISHANAIQQITNIDLSKDIGNENENKKNKTPAGENHSTIHNHDNKVVSLIAKRAIQANNNDEGRKNNIIVEHIANPSKISESKIDITKQVNTAFLNKSVVKYDNFFKDNLIPSGENLKMSSEHPSIHDSHYLPLTLPKQTTSPADIEKKDLKNFDKSEKDLVSAELLIKPVILDLTFHSYLNERNQRIITTVEGENDIERYPNDSIIALKSQIKISQINNHLKICIPLNSDLDMTIQNKKSCERISNKTTTKAKQAPNQTSINQMLNKTDKTLPSGHGVCNRKNESDTMDSTLMDIYEHDLIPLQTLIRTLKNEIETLAEQQTILKKQVLCVKQTKIPQISCSNKKPDTISPKIYMN